MPADTHRPFSQILLTPGPTPLHPETQTALLSSMLSHMDSEIFALNKAIQADLRIMYGSDPQAFTALLAGTGSLGMEAGFINLVEPGDEVLICANGSFGARMVEMAKRAGAKVRTATAPLGQAIDPADVAKKLNKHIKLVALIHGETSTGVLNPLPEIASLVQDSGALFSVDAVTTAGMQPFFMQEWGIDYVYTGSQKCLSAPPGLAPFALSDRGYKHYNARRSPPSMWYCDFGNMREYWLKGSYHHTVPVNLHYALNAALKAALKEGLDVRHKRALCIGQAVSAALLPLGFEHYVTDAVARLPTVLALRLPDYLNDAQLRQALRNNNISVAGGLGPTAGLIWRLGLMGESAHPKPYRAFLTVLEELLGKSGLVQRFDKALLAEPSCA